MTSANRELIRLTAISKSYTPGSHAVDNATFSVGQGQLVALLGPSGCGKTTTLRLIAGLEQPDTGTIWLADRQVAGTQWVPPEARRIGMVFQDYALFPHLTVAENIGFALTQQSKAQRQLRVATLQQMVDLIDLEQRYPHQLSGGQQQRVALARALAANPVALLLDEPFSNLDAALRSHMREQLRQIVRSTQLTSILVTHDQEEALSLADLIVVMFAGRIAQIGTPQQLYRTPATKQVAEFVGEANWLVAQSNGQTATCSLGEAPVQNRLAGDVELLIRPEDLRIAPDPTGIAQITYIQYLGHTQRINLQLPNGQQLRVYTGPELDYSTGTTVSVHVVRPLVAYPR